MQFKIGDLVQFSYLGKEVHDKYPQTLILHPGWRSPKHGMKLLIHALNFNYLTADEINIIRMMIDPGFELKYLENMYAKNNALATEFDNIISRAGNASMLSPHDFYLRVIRPFIMPRQWDPYRLYDPSKIANARLVQPSAKMLGKQEHYFYGTQRQKGKGKDENQILKTLAQKQADIESGTEVKTVLTPSERRFIQQLQGKALNLFNDYKKRFNAARGPASTNRSATFKKEPSWMKNPI